MGSVLALLTVGAVREASLKLRMPICEMSWVLENNTQTRHSIEDIGGRAYKTYRNVRKGSLMLGLILRIFVAAMIVAGVFSCLRFRLLPRPLSRQ